jgi:hypothetical protein
MRQERYLGDSRQEKYLGDSRQERYLGDSADKRGFSGIAYKRDICHDEITSFCLGKGIKRRAAGRLYHRR